jgi:hypothetical protein
MNIPAALSGIAHSDDAVGYCATNVGAAVAGSRAWLQLVSDRLAFSEIKKFPFPSFSPQSSSLRGCQIGSFLSPSPGLPERNGCGRENLISRVIITMGPSSQPQSQSTSQGSVGLIYCDYKQR